MAVGDAHVSPGFLTPVQTQLFFPKPPPTFLIYFCIGEKRKYAERKFASTVDRSHNDQVMSQTRLPLSQPGGGGEGGRGRLLQHESPQQMHS